MVVLPLMGFKPMAVVLMVAVLAFALKKAVQRRRDQAPSGWGELSFCGLIEAVVSNDGMSMVTFRYQEAITVDVSSHGVRTRTTGADEISVVAATAELENSGALSLLQQWQAEQSEVTAALCVFGRPQMLASAVLEAEGARCELRAGGESS